MEKSNYSTLKTRRILVVLYLMFFLALWLLLYLYVRINIGLLIGIFFVLLIINMVVELYLKSISDAFKIAKKEIQLDERLSFVRIKAQRDAYFLILITSMFMLPIGFEFYKSNTFQYILCTLCFVGTLIFNLPALIIAWQEKEV